MKAVRHHLIDDLSYKWESSSQIFNTLSIIKNFAQYASLGFFLEPSNFLSFNFSGLTVLHWIFSAECSRFEPRIAADLEDKLHLLSSDVCWYIYDSFGNFFILKSHILCEVIFQDDEPVVIDGSVVFSQIVYLFSLISLEILLFFFEVASRNWCTFDDGADLNQ